MHFFIESESPLLLLRLLGAFILLIAPGYWAWRAVGFRSSIFSPFTWAATFWASLAVVPLALNIAGISFGFSPGVVVATLILLTAAFALAARHRSVPPEPLWAGEFSAWVLFFVVGLGVFLALLVLLSYAPIKTIDGLPPVTMGDWDKHGALIWTLAETGVPPEDIFLDVSPPQPLAYYYFFHLLSAALHLLTGQALDLRWVFLLPTAALAFSLPLLLFTLGYALYKRAKPALLATYFIVWVGGLDLFAIYFILRRESVPLFRMTSWTKLLHVDAWAAPRGMHINLFYAYFIWVPHHLAALAMLLLAWLLWQRRRQWRMLRFWAPILFASMVGFSVYVTIAVLGGIAVWLAWETILVLKRKNYPDPKLWFWRGLILIAGMVILSLPMLWLYWQARSPGRGVIFASPSLAVTSLWPELSHVSSWLRPLLYLLQFFFDLGIGLVLLGLGAFLTMRAYSSVNWRLKQAEIASIFRTSLWRWMMGTGLVSLLLVAFFESSGAGPDAKRYATLNDFGMRVIMPAQVLAGFLAPVVVIWARNFRRRWAVRGLALLALLLIIPGIMATGWEMYNMAFAKYHLHWLIPNPELQALAFVRSETPTDIHFQQSVDASSEKYLLARRHPVLWGRTAPLLSADQPRAYRLLLILKEAFQTEDAKRSERLFTENGVDLIYVTERERTPAAHPQKYQDTALFHLIFDNGWVQIYQVGKKPAIAQRITLSARAFRAQNAGEIEQARAFYAQAVAAATDVGLRKDILRKWALMEQSANPTAAIDLFRQVLELDADDAEINVRLGMILLDQGEIDEAISALTTAVQQDPQHYWGWRVLAAAYEQKDDWEKALSAYQKALAVVTDANSKAASMMVMGMIRNSARLGRCEQAHTIAREFESLLQQQAEDVASALEACQ